MRFHKNNTGNFACYCVCVCFRFSWLSGISDVTQRERETTCTLRDLILGTVVVKHSIRNSEIETKLSIITDIIIIIMFFYNVK